MYCSKCGMKQDSNNKFCANCGNPIGQSTTMQQSNSVETQNINTNTGYQNNVNNGNSQYNNMNINNNVQNNNYSNGNVNNVGQVNHVNQNINSFEMNNAAMNNGSIPNKKAVNFSPLKTRKVLICLIALVVIFTITTVGVMLLGSSKSRTVMIYMVGSNLESGSGLGSRELSLLDYEKTSRNNVRVLLMAGGTTSWKNNYVSAAETSIYELTETGFVKIDRRKMNNMGSADNLSYFLNYCYEYSDTSEYDLLFWNHGGAVDGSNYDDLTLDNLKLYEMKAALEKSPFNSENRLEVVSFRTCLNGTLEVANTFDDYAEYLVSSEEITLGSAYVDSSPLEFINSIEPGDSAFDYGKKQVDCYGDFIGNMCKMTGQGKNCIDVTYSVVDLSKIDNVGKALDTFASDVNKNLTSNYNSYARIRANLNQYGQDELSYDMVDVHSMVKEFKNFSSTGTDEVLKSLEKAVVYNYTNNSYSHGLSIYYPYNATAFLKGYENISVSNNYTQFINNFTKLKNGQQINSFASFNSQKGEVSNITGKKADLELELTDEQVKNFSRARYFVFTDNKDGFQEIVYLNKDVKLDGNKLKANVRGRLLKVSDIEYEDESHWITLYEKKATDEYVDVEAIVNFSEFIVPNVMATVSIRIDDKHPAGTITSITTDDASEDDKYAIKPFAIRDVNLDEYTNIMYIRNRYKIFDSNGKFNPNFLDTRDEVIRGFSFYSDEWKFIEEDFSSDNEFYVLFEVQDVANNVYYSEPMKFVK